ncbi:23S rRNA (uracil(1939)-C(5))-methyltransferase RlmD [Lachnobacterium bovis]|uniref:23S rRNA (Uracil-5-)-methyltransferase RumA n=1 Tax=Lachnobacterium bovis TaxID=140626 RepID=A0A1H9T751_9FIRM|nr:23S rRNA (uracil(1939)-C(5))-methyltransferase RlmD [Lachnobacterium bovis]SER92403.1 23S rRNA (uracil-5-)-methyltransferase RumA [Lachnobacterium bovis]
MKKGTKTQGIVERIDFPNKGIVFTEEGEKVIVKNTIPGQKVEFVVNKVRRGKAEGRLMEVVEKSPLEEACDCPHFGICGGCVYKSLPYEKQLDLKVNQVKKLVEDAVKDKCEYEFLPAISSPLQNEYRNKMEFTFGDEYLDGPLALGMHKRGSFYDIVPVKECKIMDEDFRTILKVVTKYFDEKGVSFYHRMRHEGYLRHLLVRKATKTGEILVDLITSTQIEKLPVNEKELLEGFAKVLLKEEYKGTIKGILHTKNDSLADVVKDEGTETLFGDNFFYEEIMGLKFKISPFSFFQTNSLGAEVLYQTAREFISDSVSNGDSKDEALNEVLSDKVIFDLYSGTGTIAQMMSPVAQKVVGVEIVEEAVEAAKDNAKLNNINNCEFIAGDVLKVIDNIEEKPNYIILDPPRDGIHPKAIEKIIDYGVDHMVYISCKPTSLARDLEILLARGYKVDKIRCVDMFPFTANIETVALLQRVN